MVVGMPKIIKSSISNPRSKIKYIEIFLFLFCLGSFLQSSIMECLFTLPGELALSYQERKNQLSFGGLRFDQVEAGLDRLLPREQSVALSADLLKNDFLKQRFSETLYPRKIEATSPFLLNAMRGDFVADFKKDLKLYVSGPKLHSQELTSAPPPSESEPALFLLLLNAGILILSLSSLGWFIFKKIVHFNFAETVLSGACVVAFCTSLSTITQISVPLFALPVVGILCFSYRFFSSRKSLKFSQLTKASQIGLRMFFFHFIFLILGFIQVFRPIHMWDARSIWFFRAKEIFFQDRYTLSDIFHADYSWAHSNYPLFLPSLLTFFNSLNATSFSEQSAAIGIWVVFYPASYMIFCLAHRIYGAAPGFFFSLCLVLGISPFILGGLADGHVCIFLVLAFLSLTDNTGSLPWLAWISLGAASLLKWEGFVFALGLSLVSGRFSGNKKWGLLVFSPAIAYGFWMGSLRQPHDYQKSVFFENMLEFLPRSRAIFGGFLDVCFHSFFFLGAALAFCFSFLMIFRKSFSYAIGICICLLIFIYLAFLFSPLDLQGHIESTLPRLFLPLAAFSYLSLMEPLRRKTNTNEK